MLPRFPHLRALVVNASCAMADAAPVAATLQALPALTNLSFVRAELSAGYGGGMVAVAAALAAVPSLRSLEIGDDELSSKDVVVFSTAFPALQHLDKLAVLCTLGNAAAAALAQRASALASLSLIHI